MKPDRSPAGAGFIDRKHLNQVCLKHHISTDTASFVERNTNFVLDPGRHNKLHNLQLRTFLRSSMRVN